jgi:hypothetical protein
VPVVFEDAMVDCFLETAGVLKGRLLSILCDDREWGIAEVSSVYRRLSEA